MSVNVKENGALTKVASLTKVVDPVHYSTDEQVIGTWIDGSTLYQKTYEGITSASSSIYTLIDVGSNAVIKRFEGTIGGRGLNSYYDANNSCRTWITASGYQIGCFPNGSNFLSQPFSITLEYTKTS